MKFGKPSDITLNCVLPLLLGCFIYRAGETMVVPAFIRNYLPDGLWAYAFISTMLIIWDRVIKITWIAAVCLVAIAYELLQYYHQVPGTGDIRDIAVYFLSFIIALTLNTFFKTLFFTSNLKKIP